VIETITGAFSRNTIPSSSPDRRRARDNALDFFCSDTDRRSQLELIPPDHMRRRDASRQPVG